MDPRCLPAYANLRRLAEAGSDWARVVAVAEKQLFLEDDPRAKARQAVQIGELMRDRLNDPRRAISAYERAVEIDPQNQAGLSALAALYVEVGEWQRLIAADEKLLELAAPDDRAGRRRLLYEMAETAAEQAERRQAGLRPLPPGLQRRRRRRRPAAAGGGGQDPRPVDRPGRGVPGRPGPGHPAGRAGGDVAQDRRHRGERPGQPGARLRRPAGGAHQRAAGAHAAARAGAPGGGGQRVARAARGLRPGGAQPARAHRQGRLAAQAGGGARAAPEGPLRRRSTSTCGR